MGFFDFISSDPPRPLKERYKKALSHHYNNDKKIIRKLATIQGKLDSEIPADENIVLITYGEYSFWDGFGILTNRRIIRFNKKIEDELPISEIANIETFQNRAYDFNVIISGHAALPYKGLRTEMMTKQDLEISNANTVYLSVTMPVRAVMDQLLSALEAARAGHLG